MGLESVLPSLLSSLSPPLAHALFLPYAPRSFDPFPSIHPVFKVGRLEAKGLVVGEGREVDGQEGSGSGGHVVHVVDLGRDRHK